MYIINFTLRKDKKTIKEEIEHSSVIVQCNYLHGLSIMSINISTFLEPVIVQIQCQT